MKKLKLAALDLGAKEILTRTQLKNVFGGDDGSTGEGGGGGTASCSVTCPNKEVKTKDCGYNVICSTSGTSIRCGDAAYVNQC